MNTRRSAYTRFLLIFTLIGALGLASTFYTLVHERASLPFATGFYTVHARFTQTNGLVSGLGQPVNVVGVQVGVVANVQLSGGEAVVTMQLQRNQLPRVYSNATAALQPITPLDDMEIELNPGSPPARPLPADGTIDVGSTTAPVPLSDLLASLDGDTRSFLGSLIASVGEGTSGRGADIRRALGDLGPTATDAQLITTALASRRTELAQLVHNLSLIVHAGAQDDRLGEVVQAGDRTLHAIAAQDAPLRSALAQLPATLTVARTTLTRLQPFAAQLGPTLTALAPAVQRLPQTLRTLVPFARAGTQALDAEINPFIHAALPLARTLSPTVRALFATTPYLSGSFQALEYLTNELAYNPNVGDNQGFLFWLAWFVHNFNSVVSSGDANGGIGRAAPLATCYGLQGIAVMQQLLGVAGLCPK